MDGEVRFIRPGRGVPADVSMIIPSETSLETRQAVASSIRRGIEDSSTVVNTDAKTMHIIEAEILADDDTRFARGPVKLCDYPDVFEVNLDGFFRVVDEQTARPSEPVLMPLHATSIFFCAQHDRSNDFYCTGIITCEDEQLLNGDPERPFFVLIN